MAPPTSDCRIENNTQVIQARQLAAKRGARHISAEDLIFLIRYDRAKVNRLRTYMSWKDVRKNAKESGGDGKGDVDDVLEDGADGMRTCLCPCATANDISYIRYAEQNAAKPKKRIIKLSWDITTIYSEILKTNAANNPNRRGGHVSDDEDEDETEAHEDSVKRLRVRFISRYKELFTDVLFRKPMRRHGI